MLHLYLTGPKSPVVLGRNFRLKNASPKEFSYKPKLILDIWRQVFGNEQMIEPPGLNGTIAGGALTLTFPVGTKARALGVKVMLSAGDQTALSLMTFTITRIDDHGQSVVQVIAGTPTTRASELYIAFASMSSDITKPEVHHQGNAKVIPGPADVNQTTVIAIAGPTGMEVSAELLTAKHPDVKQLFDSTPKLAK